MLDVHFSPQLEKSRPSTSVSINSTAGRPSGWAVPRILVVFGFIFHCIVARFDAY